MTTEWLEKQEDLILRRIFLISLAEPSPDDDPDVIYLEQTAAELLSEGHPLLLVRDSMERILTDRLFLPEPSLPPFTYLVDSFRRAGDESRMVSSRWSVSFFRSHFYAAIKAAKELLMLNARILATNPEILPSSSTPPSAEIFSFLLKEFGPGNDSGSDSGVKAPPGFLEEFFSNDDLGPLLLDLYDRLKGSVERVSAFGDFLRPLGVLLLLVEFQSCARGLVNHPKWIPELTHPLIGPGRMIEITSILGAFLHVSALPDYMDFKSNPDVGLECYSKPTRRLGDVFMGSNFSRIKILMNRLYCGLADVLCILLKNVDTRDKVVDYLAEVIMKNLGRSNIQIDPLSCASTGMFVNLSAVMLRLCEPFLNGNALKIGMIDSKYAFHGRLDFRPLTAMHASSEEVEAWVDGKSGGESSVLNSQEASSSGSGDKDHFICESCFFMTAQVLNLGLIKALSYFKHLEQDLERCFKDLSNLNGMRDQGGTPQLEEDIKRLEKEIDMYAQDKFCYEAQIRMDWDLLRKALSFYRLVVKWLVDLVGGFKMPLPSNCPMEFTCMPEHVVEDAMDLLIMIPQTVLDDFTRDDFLIFNIMFMESPSYFKNPYLRAKMVEVLIRWKLSVVSLLEGHQLSLDYLVRNLLKLYVDIEFTGSHTQLFDKFTIRNNIANLFEYLWHTHSQRNTWMKIAREDEKGVYLNFLNFLINDSIYLLDESLNKILELKELEAEMSNSVEWEQRSAQEREERMHLFNSQKNIVRFDMKLANEDVGMLALTSEIPAPFLLPEMVERVASMLNYFLLQLVGPQRRTLTVEDLEKYEFRPKQLLKQIAEIYVHIESADRECVFPSAISKDGRSYNAQLFAAAADILWEIPNAKLDVDLKKVIERFVQIGIKAKTVASEAMDTEAVHGEIPDEFLDPIQDTLMKDPVILSWPSRDNRSSNNSETPSQ